MKSFLPFSLLIFMVLGNVYASQTRILGSCVSPDQQLKAVVTLEAGKPEYCLLYKTDTLISPSSLGFILSGNDSLTQFRFVDSRNEKTTREEWKPVWGISSLILNYYNETWINLEDTRKGRKMSVVLRCYDDGFAFRYVFPEQKNLKDFVIMSEETRMRFSGEWECWWGKADLYNLEQKFYHTPLDSAKHVQAPFTMHKAGGPYLCVHEAAIEDYTTMTILREAHHQYRVNLVPWADGSAVKTKAPMNTPWRVFYFATRAGALMESNLLLNLNEPCAIKETSWIKPMNYVGIWWGMHIGTNTWIAGPRHGATTENTKKYIDFAAKNGIGGVLVEGWNTGWENWGKPEAFDFVTPYPDFNLPEIAAYAKSKGIAFIGHHETGGDIITYESRVKDAFALYKKLGIHAVKTGYAGGMVPKGENHLGQCKVRHCNYIMKLAAEYEIMIDAHEPMVMSGLSRTWPNLMATEAARGMEYNAWSEGNPPTHTCTLPFTRLMAGPMDYTPGIFDIDLSNAKGRIRPEVPDSIKLGVHSTIANQLALEVVLYSPVQMASDLIENYEGNPAFNFIKGLPTSWDETRVIDAAIGEYILVARRKGNDWFVGAITNENARTLDLPLSFLLNGKKYQAELYQDDAAAHYETNPERITISQKEIRPGETLKLKLAAGGGAAVRIRLM
jgi:alpha-glucosidase